MCGTRIKVTLKVTLKFIDLESLGTDFSPKCRACMCGKCSLENRSCTKKEEQELKMIADGLTLDEEKKEWTVQYPWNKSSMLLPNNYAAVYARLRSMEKRLLKNGQQYIMNYNREIQDMIDRNVARKITEEELCKYCVGVHYIPHHEVLKPGLLSTPTRIVLNSSASYMGHHLNDYWAKGPNVLSDLLAILLRFRQYQVALVADIKKMYNTIRLSVEDQHTHIFLWRWMKL